MAPPEIRVPGSKSLTLRHLLGAALAPGTSRLFRAGDSDDARALSRSLERLGATIVREGEDLRVIGVDHRLPAGPLELDAGESGAVARFLAALLAHGRGGYRIACAGRLARRPFEDLAGALAQSGASLGAEDGRLAVQAGPHAAARLELGGLRSSQTLSALLLAAPLAPRGIAIHCPPELPSAGYVELTLSAMARHGVAVERGAGWFQVGPAARYRPAEVPIEGDWSAAAILLAAAAAMGRPLRLLGLDPGSAQPDRAAWELLERSAVELRFAGGVLESAGRPRRGLEADLDACPDLFPPLAALAATLPWPSRFGRLERLRDKESDRLAAMCEGLAAAGARIDRRGPDLIVQGGGLRPAVLRGHRDHRVVMSLAFLALCVPGSSVTDRAAVAKSFPRFFAELERIRQAD